MKIITVVAAVIRREGKVLLTSRPVSKPPLGWEFPGGKVEPGENFNAALRRELLEELGVDSVPADRLYKVVTRNAEREIRLHFIGRFDISLQIFFGQNRLSAGDSAEERDALCFGEREDVGRLWGFWNYFSLHRDIQAHEPRLAHIKSFCDAIQIFLLRLVLSGNVSAY